MANPTSNFNWQMPTPTDLVTDLPADFEVFGQAVDSSMADLLGGTTGQVLAKNSNTNMDFVWVAQDDSNAIQNAIVDAKGDLIAASANDTPARLAVGANGETLVADSSTATGLNWAAPGGMTLLSTTTLSGATTTISSISQSYQDLEIWIYGMNTTQAGIRWQPNGNDNGSNLSGIYASGASPTTYSGVSASNFLHNAGNQMTGSNTTNAWTIKISNYTSTGYKPYQLNGSMNVVSSTIAQINETGVIIAASALTSIALTGGSFSGGTVKIWGIK
jgi:hypothetical protein